MCKVQVQINAKKKKINGLLMLLINMEVSGMLYILLWHIKHTHMHR